jgi:hypothetical protein
MRQCGEKGAAATKGFGMEHRKGTSHISYHNHKAGMERFDGVGEKGGVHHAMHDKMKKSEY